MRNSGDERATSLDTAPLAVRTPQSAGPTLAPVAWGVPRLGPDRSGLRSATSSPARSCHARSPAIQFRPHLAVAPSNLDHSSQQRRNHASGLGHFRRVCPGFLATSPRSGNREISAAHGHAPPGVVDTPFQTLTPSRPLKHDAASGETGEDRSFVSLSRPRRRRYYRLRSGHGSWSRLTTSLTS
jgi:hypothetical protein